MTTRKRPTPPNIASGVTSAVERYDMHSPTNLLPSAVPMRKESPRPVATFRNVAPPKMGFLAAEQFTQVYRTTDDDASNLTDGLHQSEVSSVTYSQPPPTPTYQQQKQKPEFSYGATAESPYRTAKQPPNFHFNNNLQQDSKPPQKKEKVTPDASPPVVTTQSSVQQGHVKKLQLKDFKEKKGHKAKQPKHCPRSRSHSRSRVRRRGSFRGANKEQSNCEAEATSQVQGCVNGTMELTRRLGQCMSQTADVYEKEYRAFQFYPRSICVSPDLRAAKEPFHSSSFHSSWKTDLYDDTSVVTDFLCGAAQGPVAGSKEKSFKRSGADDNVSYESFPDIVPPPSTKRSAKGRGFPEDVVEVMSDTCNEQVTHEAPESTNNGQSPQRQNGGCNLSDTGSMRDLRLSLFMCDNDREVVPHARLERALAELEAQDHAIKSLQKELAETKKQLDNKANVIAVNSDEQENIGVSIENKLAEEAQKNRLLESKISLLANDFSQLKSSPLVGCVSPKSTAPKRPHEQHQQEQPPPMENSSLVAMSLRTEAVYLRSELAEAKAELLKLKNDTDSEDRNLLRANIQSLQESLQLSEDKVRALENEREAAEHMIRKECETKVNEERGTLGEKLVRANADIVKLSAKAKNLEVILSEKIDLADQLVNAQVQSKKFDQQATEEREARERLEKDLKGKMIALEQTLAQTEIRAQLSDDRADEERKAILEEKQELALKLEQSKEENTRIRNELFNNKMRTAQAESRAASFQHSSHANEVKLLEIQKCLYDTRNELERARDVISHHVGENERISACHEKRECELQTKISEVESNMKMTSGKEAAQSLSLEASSQRVAVLECALENANKELNKLHIEVVHQRLLAAKAQAKAEKASSIHTGDHVKLDSLRSALERAHQDLKQLRDASGGAEMMSQLSASKAKLRMQVELTSAVYEACTRRQLCAEEELSRAKEELEASVHAEQDLAAELRLVRADFSASDEACRRVTEELQCLREQADNQLETCKQEEEQKRESLVKELYVIQEKLKTLEIEKVRAFMESKELAKEVAHLKRTATWESSVEEIWSEKVKASEDECLRLTEEVKRLKERAGQLELQTQDETETRQLLMDELEKTRESLRKLELEMAEVVTEKDISKEQTIMLRSHVSDANNQAQAKEVECCRLREDVIRLQDRASQLESQTVEHAEKMKLLTVELEDTRASLRELALEKAGIVTEKHALNEQATSLQTQLLVARKKSDALDDENCHLKGEMQTLQKRVEDMLEAQAADAEHKLSLLSELDESKVSNEQLALDKASLELMVEKLSNDIAHSKHARETADPNCENMNPSRLEALSYPGGHKETARASSLTSLAVDELDSGDQYASVNMLKRRFLLNVRKGAASAQTLPDEKTAAIHEIIDRDGIWKQQRLEQESTYSVSTGKYVSDVSSAVSVMTSDNLDQEPTNVVAMQAEIVMLHSTISRLKEDVNAAETKSRKLQLEMDDLKDLLGRQADEAALEKQTYLKENRALSQDLANSRDAREILLGKISVLEDNVAKHEAEIEVLMSKLVVHQSLSASPMTRFFDMQCSDVDQHCGGAQGKLLEITKASEFRLQAEVERLRNDMQELQTDKNASQNQLKESNEREQHLRSEAQTLQEKLLLLVESHESLLANLQEARNSKLDEQHLRSELQTLQEQIADLEDTNESLMAKVEGLQTLQEQITDLEETNESLVAKIEEAGNLKLSMKRELEDILTLLEQTKKKWKDDTLRCKVEVSVHKEIEKGLVRELDQLKQIVDDEAIRIDLQSIFKVDKLKSRLYKAETCVARMLLLVAREQRRSACELPGASSPAPADPPVSSFSYRTPQRGNMSTDHRRASTNIVKPPPSSVSVSTTSSFGQGRSEALMSNVTEPELKAINAVLTNFATAELYDGIANVSSPRSDQAVQTPPNDEDGASFARGSPCSSVTSPPSISLAVRPGLPIPEARYPNPSLLPPVQSQNTEADANFLNQLQAFIEKRGTADD